MYPHSHSPFVLQLCSLIAYFHICIQYIYFDMLYASVCSLSLYLSCELNISFPCICLIGLRFVSDWFAFR